MECVLGLITTKVEFGVFNTQGEVRCLSWRKTLWRWTEPPILFETWKPNLAGSWRLVERMKPVRVLERTRRPLRVTS